MSTDPDRLKTVAESVSPIGLAFIIAFHFWCEKHRSEEVKP